MTKYIIHLMLSAAIFTTTPLLAMEPESVKDEGKSIHTYTSCSPELSPCTEEELKTGKGDLIQFELEDLLIKYIQYLPYNDLLSLSRASKIMNYFCTLPTVWMAIEPEMPLNKNLCTMCQVKDHKLFRSKEKEYVLTRSKTQSLMQLTLTNSKDELQKKLSPFVFAVMEQDFAIMEQWGSVTNFGASWSSFLGNRKFKIENELSTDTKYLELLDENTPLTFKWQTNTIYYKKPCFGTDIWIIIDPEAAQNFTFNTPEYIQYATSAHIAGKSTPFRISIKEIEPEETKSENNNNNNNQ